MFRGLRQNFYPDKAASVCQFLTPKKLQPFITPRTFHIYLRQTILYPKLKMKFGGIHFADVAEIQEA